MMEPSDVVIITAYSKDYTLGKLCEAINRVYAEEKGHIFISEEFECDVITELIAPKLHFTWYKIYLMLRKMKEMYSEESDGRCQYIMWIDADAIFVDSTQNLLSLISEAHYKEMLIAEDMHTGNLLNAGVFLLKVCPWSVNFLQDVYASTRYDTVPFYEQSAMISILKKYRETILIFFKKPFHSHVSGCYDVKIGKHLAVFPCHRLNTNLNVISKEEVEYYSNAHAEPVADVSKEKIFIFHAAGLKNKLGYMKAVVKKYEVAYDKDEIDLEQMVFAPVRNSKGQYSKELVELKVKFQK